MCAWLKEAHVAKVCWPQLFWCIEHAQGSFPAQATDPKKLFVVRVARSEAIEAGLELEPNWQGLKQVSTLRRQLLPHNLLLLQQQQQYVRALTFDKEASHGLEAVKQPHSGLDVVSLPLTTDLQLRKRALTNIFSATQFCSLGQSYTKAT